MKKIIFIAFVFCILPFLAFAAEKVEGKNMVLVLSNSPSALAYSNVYLQPGPETIFFGEGDYTGEIFDSENNSLFQFSFFFDDTAIVENAGEIETTVKKELALPYYKEAALIMLAKKDGSKKLDVSVGFLADLCGNGKCDAHESYGDCPADCEPSGKDNYCNKTQDLVCDPDCGKALDADCTMVPIPDNLQPEMEIFSKNALLQIAEGQKAKSLSLDNIWFVAVVALVLIGLFLFGRKIQKDKAEQ